MSAVDGGSSVVARELDYKTVAAAWPKPMFTRILPLSGGTAVDVSPVSPIEVQMEIPTKVVYLNKSYLSFTVTPPAPGGTRFNWMIADAFTPVSEIVLATRSGVEVAHLYHVPQSTKVVRKATTPTTAYESLSTLDGLTRNNMDKLNNLAKRYDGIAPDVPYSEPLYARVGGDNEAGPVLQYQFCLGDLPHSVFALNKALYFGEIMQLRIMFGKGTTMGWTAPSATIPHTGSADIAGNIAITNLRLDLCVETEPNVIKAIESKFTSGISIPIDYTYANKVRLNAGSATATLRYTGAHGQLLKRVYTAAFNSAETKNDVLDCSNVTGAAGAKVIGSKITSYHTTLDNVRIQQHEVVVAENMDWLENRKYIRGTFLGLSPDVYRYNGAVHIDAWDHGQSPADASGSVPEDNVRGGLDVTGKERIYTYNANAAVATNVYSWAVMQRQLVIGGGGGVRLA